MMKWLNQELLGELIFTNSERAEAMIREVEPLLNEILPFILDAALQYRVYHDDTEHGNYFGVLRIFYPEQYSVRHFEADLSENNVSDFLLQR